MKAGFAEVDITPSVGMRFCGAAPLGVQTPCCFTAAYFETDTAKIALVGADLIRMNRDLLDDALPILRARLPLDLLICGASHTHAAPPLHFWEGVLSPAEIMALNDVRPEVRQQIVESIGEPDLEYGALLRRRLVDAVCTAWQRREDVRLVVGKTLVERVAYNRRQKMKNGLTVTHAGKGNPEIVDYAGPTDKTVTTLGAVNAAGKTIGAVVNFACHGTVVQEKYFSADWPYYMRQTVRRNINQDMPVVFLNGCCGDVTQIDNLSSEPELRTDAWARVLGQRVGFGAVDALACGVFADHERMRYVAESLDLEYRPISDERYRAALELVNNHFDQKSMLVRYHARDTVLLKHKIARSPKVSCELNAAQIGDLLLVSFPGEIFARMGLDLRANAPLPFVMPVTLANGHLGYVPTPDVFGSGGGGYEGKLGGSSCLEIGAFDKMRASALALIEKLAISPACPPKELKPGKPWCAYRPDEL